MRSLCLRIVTSHTNSPRHDQSILSSVNLFVFLLSFCSLSPVSGILSCFPAQLPLLVPVCWFLGQSLAILLEILGEDEIPIAEITSAKGLQDTVYLAKYGMRAIYHHCRSTAVNFCMTPDCTASTKKRQIMKSVFGGSSIR